MKTEELYEKCRALISALSFDGFGEADRSALMWILVDYYEKLGEAIGIIRQK